MCDLRVVARLAGSPAAGPTTAGRASFTCRDQAVNFCLVHVLPTPFLPQHKEKQLKMNGHQEVRAPTNPLISKHLGHVLVTGGCGFLGANIVTLLQSRQVCSKLSVLDLRPSTEPKDGVEYHFGDITDSEKMHALLAQLQPDVVIHTASPHFNIASKDIMRKVNVTGTEVIVSAAQQSGVKAFVYTSSASVISDQKTDLVHADESYPLIMGAAQPQYYTTTKAQAEVHVLESNRPAAQPQFLTAAIRPSGIFGVGDVQLLPKMVTAYHRGQTRFQLGENDNLFEFTEVTNVAHAHQLAAAALLATAEREAQGLSIPLDTERVDGEAFLVTNDAPVYFWDFARTVWRTCGDKTTPAQVWALPRAFGLFLATMFEWIFWVLRLGEPNLKRDQVKFSCMTRYFDIDKAKSRLGYRPVIGLQAGIERAVRDILRKEALASEGKKTQ